jgi:hypothetical protein
MNEKDKLWKEYCEAEEAYTNLARAIQQYDHPDLIEARDQANRLYELWEGHDGH